MASKDIDNIGKLEADVSRLNAWMVGVIIALAVAFCGVFIAVGSFINDANAQKTSTYLDLRDNVKEQNTRIDNLIEKAEKTNSQLEELTERIEALGLKH